MNDCRTVKHFKFLVVCLLVPWTNTNRNFGKGGCLPNVFCWATEVAKIYMKLAFSRMYFPIESTLPLRKLDFYFYIRTEILCLPMPHRVVTAIYTTNQIYFFLLAKRDICNGIAYKFMAPFYAVLPVVICYTL